MNGGTKGTELPGRKSVNPHGYDYQEETLELVVQAVWTGEDFTYTPDRPIRGVSKIYLTQAFLSGVALTAGVPNDNYYTVQLSGININTRTGTGSGQGVTMYNLGERTRSEYSDRLLVESRQTMGDTVTNLRVSIRKPDGTQASAADVGFVGLDFRVKFVPGVRQ